MILATVSIGSAGIGVSIPERDRKLVDSTRFVTEVELPHDVSVWFELQ